MFLMIVKIWMFVTSIISVYESFTNHINSQFDCLQHFKMHILFLELKKEFFDLKKNKNKKQTTKNCEPKGIDGLVFVNISVILEEKLL